MFGGMVPSGPMKVIGNDCDFFSFLKKKERKKNEMDIEGDYSHASCIAASTIIVFMWARVCSHHNYDDINLLFLK